jgi:hypothetical protein
MCYHLYRSKTGRLSDAVFAGVAFSVAYACDPAGAIFVIAAAILLWGAPLRRWALFTTGALPLIAGQFAYNMAISGSLLPAAFNLNVWSDPSLPLHAESRRLLLHHSATEYMRFAVNLLIGTRGFFTFTPLMFAAVYGCYAMWKREASTRRLAIALIATFAAYFFAIIFLQEGDIRDQNFGERRYVDVFFVLAPALAAALASVRTARSALAMRAAIVVSIAIAMLGTLTPFAGRRGDWGFAFAAAAFKALAQRSPVQAGIDIVLLIVLIALALRIANRAMLRVT